MTIGFCTQHSIIGKFIAYSHYISIQVRSSDIMVDKDIPMKQGA